MSKWAIRVHNRRTALGNREIRQRKGDPGETIYNLPEALAKGYVPEIDAQKSVGKKFPN
jgi:hypothetical protein